MKKLMMPLFVLAALALANLACLDTNYYGVRSPVPVATSTPQEVAATQEGGQDLIMAVAMIILIFVSGGSMLDKASRMDRGARLIYQGVYWLSLLGGLVVFAWGVFNLNGLWVATGAGWMMASIPWGFWGNHLF